MPEIVSEIARSKNGCLRAGMVASGGESLRDHWSSGDVKRELAARRWQYVVFQDQSAFGEVYLVNGQYRIHDATNLFVYGHRLFAIVRAQGGIPIVFLPWAPQSALSRDARYMKWAYSKFAREENAKLVPAIDAWALAQRELPEISLYREDGLHPTAAGSYLTAALFYTALLKKSPVGAASTILGPAIDFQSGEVKLGTRVILADLSESAGSRLQMIALEVARQGREGVPLEPPPISLPRARRGQTISLKCLHGRWIGSSFVYPDRAKMTLNIGVHPLTVGAIVDFGGRPETIRFADSNPKLTAKSLIFTDVHGPNGGHVKYTAILENSALSGVGEILVPHYPIYGVGMWSARQVAGECPESQ